MGYGLGMRIRSLVLLALTVLLVGCLSESGLRDEVREATEAIDTLIDEIGDSGPIRDAASEARDAVEESRAALEAFREDPNAETRQALLEAETHLNDARTKLDGALEDAPEAIRESLGEVVDALERIRRSIRQEFED
jgi:DNA repair ATPase RecN